jgi:hypothetical protein
VSDVLVTESGNFATPVATVTVTEEKKSVVGYNVGADATYIFWQNDDVRIGAGGFVRFTGANADIPVLGTNVETKLGGVQFGFGGRVRF